MKKLLFVLAATTLVFFSSCRHDDFELLRHKVHVQGGANVHLGTPVGTGEMSIDDLFNMINDTTINNMMDSTSNVITLHYETSMTDTVSGGNFNLGAKKAIGQMMVKNLPWGQNRVSRRWAPRRTNNDHKWTPRVSSRVNAAKTGQYNNAKDGSTPDNIFSYSDTVSYAIDLNMLTNSSFFSDADFELNTVSLDFGMNLLAVCPEAARHYLDDYLTVTIDSLVIFYTDEDGIEHAFSHAPFDGSMAPNVFGHYSPTGVGITQQPIVLSYSNVNIAEIVNAKPTSMKARFRFTIDVARSMVLDVVARPDFDTTGLFLTGLDLNTVNLNDVSNMDTASLMNNVRDNLASVDTLWLINYLFNANIDTTNPQTVLDFLNIDTGYVLNYLGIDTTRPRTVLYAAGFTDTSDLALGVGAGLPVNATGDAFDTCELIKRALHLHDCEDTNSLIAGATNDSGYHDGALDTNYFLRLLTGNPNLTTDSTVAILNWIGIDTSESNLGNILLDAGLDTSDHEAMIYGATGHHLITGEDTTYFLQTILGNDLDSPEDTTALVELILGHTLQTENDTNWLIAQVTGHPYNDTNYYLQQITGNPTITQSDTNALLSIATGGAITSTSDTNGMIQEAVDCPSTSDTNCILFKAIGHTTSDTNAILSLATNGTITSTNDTNSMLQAAIGHTTSDTNAILSLATGGAITSKTDTCNIIKAATNNAITNCNDTTQYMNAFGIDTVGIVNSIDTTGMIDPAEYVGMTPAQIQARKDQLYDHLRDSVENAMKAQVEDSITGRVQNYVKNNVSDYIADTVSNYVKNTVSDYITDTVQKYVDKKISHYINTSVTGYFDWRIEDYVTNTVTDYITDTVTSYVTDTMESYFTDRIAEYVEDVLGDYLEDTITNALKQGIQDIIVPRITDYVLDTVTDYVTNKVLKAYRDTIYHYLEERVREYVYDVFVDTLHYVMNQRLENFTALKDTLLGIMDEVSEAKYACSATVAVNVPFEIKIGHLSYPLEVELWKDGGNALDVEAILNKLPNFVDASLDDSYFNMRVANGMPLEFVVSADLLDANKNVLCNLIPNDTIKSAQLTQVENNPTCWEASDTTISVIRATMDQDKLFKVKNSKYVRMNLTLSSNNKFVYVKRTDKMAFRAFLQANANAQVDLVVPHTPLPIPNIF